MQFSMDNQVKNVKILYLLQMRKGNTLGDDICLKMWVTNSTVHIYAFVVSTCKMYWVNMAHDKALTGSSEKYCQVLEQTIPALTTGPLLSLLVRSRSNVCGQSLQTLIWLGRLKTILLSYLLITVCFLQLPQGCWPFDFKLNGWTFLQEKICKMVLVN